MPPKRFPCFTPGQRDILRSFCLHEACSMLLCFLLSECRYEVESPYHGVEVFAGCKSLTEQMIRRGLRFASFEKDDGQDILTDVGYLTLLNMIRNTMRGGLIHYATVCSSWVFLNLGTSQRSPSRPLGTDQGYATYIIIYICGVCRNYDSFFCIIH